MGWWPQNKQGVSFTRNEGGPEMFWGDVVADELDLAVDEIVKHFKRDHNRKPTKDELRAGMEFLLGAYDEVET